MVLRIGYFLQNSKNWTFVSFFFASIYWSKNMKNTQLWRQIAQNAGLCRAVSVSGPTLDISKGMQTLGFVSNQG